MLKLLAATAAALTLTLTSCATEPTAPPAAQDDSTNQGLDESTSTSPSETESSETEPSATPTEDTDLDDTPATPTEPPRKKKARLYAVVDVVDGDTVKLNYRGVEESIRIIGIDTPETVHPSVPDECWGPHASAAATKLLSGKRVRVNFDPSQGRRDAYDRLLGYIGIPGLGDFGRAMIRRGHAIEYTYDAAYEKQAIYRAAEQSARAADRGLWPACGDADSPLNEPEPTPEPPPADTGGNCEPGYDPCVPAFPPDLDCGDVDGPINVTGEDPHGLDGEGDGIACES